MTFPLDVIKVDEKFIIGSEISSKGNQAKFRYRDKWIKIDGLGYESLAECICSDMLEVMGIAHVAYYPCLVDIGEKVHGCYSFDYCEDKREITLAKVLMQLVGEHGLNFLFKDKPTEQRIEAVYHLLSPYIDSDEFYNYIYTLLSFDALVLNEDRHLNNISFFYGSGRLHPTPIYDNGAALLSDTREYYGYPLDAPTSKLIRKVKAKPFSASFKKQTFCELSIPWENILEIINRYEDIYDKSIIRRVHEVLYYTMKGR